MLVFVWHALLCVHSSFAIILTMNDQRAGYFVFIVFQMSCDWYCTVALPYSAVGWSQSMIS